MSERSKNRRIDWALGGLIFLMLMLRACAFGAQYWYQLDDYIQYHNYAAGNDFWGLVEAVGLLASRPLAGIADYFVWSPLFDHMIVGVAIISALYAVSAVLMKRLISRYFALSPLFLLVMAMLPLGVEGTYWMSASTRIVVGIFFACLTGWSFAWWLDRGGWYRGLLFMAVILLPFGFYEQAAVLAMTLALGMGLLEFRKHRRRALLALWSLPAAGIYLKLTSMLAGSGVYGSRMDVVLPVSKYYWDTFLPDMLGQIKTVFTEGLFYTLVKGFVRGMRQVFSGELLLWFLLAVLVCVLYGWLAGRCGGEGERTRSVPLALVTGILLTIAPVTPFLILGGTWFSFRGAVPSFAGMALVCDTIFLLLRGRIPHGRWVGAAFVGVTALVLCVAGASEVGDYRGTYLDDQQAARVIVQDLPKDYPAAESIQGVEVGILGLEASMLDNVNFSWHEHFRGCTESSWALTGLLSCQYQGVTLPAITPLPTDPIYKAWNRETNRIDRFDVLYYYDGERLERLTLEQTGEMNYEVYGQDGRWMGRIWEEDKIGYFRTAEQLAEKENG